LDCANVSKIRWCPVNELDVDQLTEAPFAPVGPESTAATIANNVNPTVLLGIAIFYLPRIN
jgi:hypothetical protein